MPRLGKGEILAPAAFQGSLAGPLRPTVRQVGGIVFGTPVVRPLRDRPDAVVALVELPFDLYVDHELRSVDVTVSIRGARVLSTWPGPDTAPGDTVGVGDDLTLRPGGSLRPLPHRAQLPASTGEPAGDRVRWSLGGDRALPEDGYRLLLVVALPAGTETVEGHLSARATISQYDGTWIATTSSPELGFSVPLRPPAPVAPAEPPRKGSGMVARGRDWPGGDRSVAEVVPRHLHARMVDRVGTGRPLSLVVAVTRAAVEGVARLKDLVVPPEGVDLTVLVSAPGLVLRGEREATVHVPAGADSEPYRFALMAGPVGLHTLTVEAFHGGTYLGAVSLQVSVERSVGAVRENVRVAELPTVATEPGEVTLQVRRDGDDYRFQLIADAWYDEIPASMGDVTAEVSELARELRAMAADKSPYRAGADVRDRVRSLGIGLWSAAVPEAVRRQFWETGRIETFTVVAEKDTIPWELLYPLDGTHDNGFLVEQFPVVRRVLGERRVPTLPLGSAAYIVPPNAPENALAEIAGIRSRLADRIDDDRGDVSALAGARRLVLDSPGLVHFACHNSFSDSAGSSIALDGGPWKPTDLAEAMARRTMSAARPLVFLNACRSAGEAHWFSEMNGWARSFAKAGAGAFVGTLWAVRSTSAKTFAEAFYQQFVNKNQPLGRASLLARKAVADDDGDPTWLAYTVYGNPAATVERVTP